jgi:DNA-binding PadR family transcriptional regulator
VPQEASFRGLLLTKAAPPSRLTKDEGAFLSLLVRVEPATGYQLARIYEQSPVTNFGTSKGKIYPLIRRLKSRRLISARSIADRRGTEILRSTSKGVESVRSWMKEIKPADALLDDPLRTVVQSFDLLSETEQLEWIFKTRNSLEAKLVELEKYAFRSHGFFNGYVLESAVSSVKCRLSWLVRLERSIRRRESIVAG